MTIMQAKYIPRGTSVLVSDQSYQLCSHIMIHDHRFHDEDLITSGILPIVFKGTGLKQPITPRELTIQGCFTVKTLNPEWPYIVVRSSMVKMMRIPVRQGKAPKRKM